MKKLLILAAGLLFSAPLAFAQDWYVTEYTVLKNDAKAEFARLYDDFHDNAAKMQIRIVNTSSQLAKAIEDKKGMPERERLIQKLTNEIVTMADDARYACDLMSAKAGHLSRAYARDVYEQAEIADSFYNNLFSSDGVRHVYELLDEAGINTPSKREIVTLYGNKITSADNRLDMAYNKYRGYWMAGITSGADYAKARADYYAAVKNVITVASDIYAAEIAKLPKAQIQQVAERRERWTTKEINNIKEHAILVKAQMQKRLDSMND